MLPALIVRHAFFGLAIGSFLNVLIYPIPRRLNFQMRGDSLHLQVLKRRLR